MPDSLLLLWNDLPQLPSHSKTGIYIHTVYIYIQHIRKIPLGVSLSSQSSQRLPAVKLFMDMHIEFKCDAVSSGGGQPASPGEWQAQEEPPPCSFSLRKADLILFSLFSNSEEP